MVILIEFLGKQRLVTRASSITMPLAEGARVTDALEYVRNQYPTLQLNKDEVLITVNHEMATPDKILSADDTVSFLPFIHGG